MKFMLYLLFICYFNIITLGKVKNINFRIFKFQKTLRDRKERIKIKLEDDKDSHFEETRELYEFHAVPEKERKTPIYHEDYKDFHEENYDKHNMGYHADYAPIDENR